MTTRGDRVNELAGACRAAARRLGMAKTTTHIDVTAAAAALGRKGGLIRSERKAAASRENGRKGGRPRKTQPETK